MRRTAFRILLVITVLAAVAPIEAAQVCEPMREPVQFGDFTLPANRCGFPIDVSVVSNNECQDVTALADGTVITKITGRLVLKFTNNTLTPPAYIIRNVSGPSTETDNPDGSGMF